MRAQAQRQNDFEGEMGEKYEQAMQIICPQAEEMKRLIANRVREFTNLNKKKVLDHRAVLLDLGCGGGSLINEIYYADIENSGVDIFVGVDKSEVMLDTARKRLYMPWVNEEVKLVKEDITKYLKNIARLGWKANFITSTFVLHNLTQDERLRISPLVYQVLSLEGAFYIGDKIARTNPEEHSRDYLRQIKLIESLAEHSMPELVQPWKKHYQEDDKPERIMVEAELKKMLIQTGFRKVRTIYREGMEAIIEAKK